VSNPPEGAGGIHGSVVNKRSSTVVRSSASGRARQAAGVVWIDIVAGVGPDQALERHPDRCANTAAT
jgi:hypothetical protein